MGGGPAVTLVKRLTFGRVVVSLLLLVEVEEVEVEEEVDDFVDLTALPAKLFG
jgi:hypothetical protein